MSGSTAPVAAVVDSATSVDSLPDSIADVPQSQSASSASEQALAPNRRDSNASATRLGPVDQGYNHPHQGHHHGSGGSILLGSLVSSCHILTNMDGERGAFFIFSDLGVRSSGSFRLRFDLFDLELASYRGGVVGSVGVFPGG
ncbi:hypothetical protein HK101_003222, partial [Irineochytrium annulatum]